MSVKIGNGTAISCVEAAEVTGGPPAKSAARSARAAKTTRGGAHQDAGSRRSRRREDASASRRPDAALHEAAPRSAGALQGLLPNLCRTAGDAARNVVILGALAGLALSPGTAKADYVDIDRDEAARVVVSPHKAPVTPSEATGEPEFDPARLKNYGLFRLFWESDVQGTSQRGVWSLSPRGVGALLRYARTQTLDGRPVPQIESGGAGNGGSGVGAPPPPVTEGHRKLVEFLLTDEYYSAFISQDAVPLLRLAFDLPEVEVRARAETAPTDAGQAASCMPGGWWGTQGIGDWRIRDLPQALRSEYELGSGVGRYDRTASPIAQRAEELTCLLQQFSDALNHWDDLALPRGDQVKHQIQEEMLDQFFALPVFDVNAHGEDARSLRRHFATDFNGSGMGVAQAIAKGFDPNNFPMSFPDANDRNSPVSLSMSTQNLRGAMVALDEWRRASGLQPLAIETKDRSAMGYIVGDPSGHDNFGLTEKTPFSSGINFGKLIEFGSNGTGFAQSPVVAGLRVKPGFEFPIDVVLANGQAVAASGARIEVVSADTRERVNVEPIVERGPDEKGPAVWSAKFIDRDGNELQPTQVIGLVKRGDHVLGDGRADQTLDTGYWGMCDDNTGSDITFGRYTELPTSFQGQTDDGRIYVRAANSLFGFLPTKARELVYMDLPGVGGTEWPSNAGYRFGNDSSQMRWARGGFVHTNTGKLDGFVPTPFTQRHHRFVDGDVIRIDNRKDAPLRGSLRVKTFGGSTSAIPAERVVGIARVDEKRVKVIYKVGNVTTSELGELLTEVPIDWSKGRASTSTTYDRAGDLRYIEQGETLRSFFERYVAPGGVTFEQFEDANRAARNRPAASIGQNELVRIPAYDRSYVIKAGDTVGSVFAAEVRPLDIDWPELQSANQEVFAMTTPPTSGSTELHDQLLPEGRTLTLKVPPRAGRHTGVEVITLQAFYEEKIAPLGVSLDDFRSANTALFSREIGWTRAGDRLLVPQLYVENDRQQPFAGDFKMSRDDGIDITVRSNEVEWLQGETPYDLPFTHYLRFAQLSKGVWGQDSSLARSISNGRKWINEIRLQETRGGDRPEWAEGHGLLGRNGPIERRAGDKIVFAAGTTPRSTAFAGWYQVDQGTGRILNEGFILGQPDFAFGTIARPLNWNARSTYIGEAMPAALRLQLVINGIPALRDLGPRADEIAKILDLPANWKSYIVSKEEVERFLGPPPAAVAPVPAEPAAPAAVVVPPPAEPVAPVEPTAVVVPAQ